MSALRRQKCSIEARKSSADLVQRKGASSAHSAQAYLSTLIIFGLSPQKPHTRKSPMFPSLNVHRGACRGTLRHARIAGQDSDQMAAEAALRNAIDAARAGNANIGQLVMLADAASPSQNTSCGSPCWMAHDAGKQDGSLTIASTSPTARPRSSRATRPPMPA
jgi:hypothetical protein